MSLTRDKSVNAAEPPVHKILTNTLSVFTHRFKMGENLLNKFCIKRFLRAMALRLIFRDPLPPSWTV